MGNVDLGGIPLFAGLMPEHREQAAAVARQLQWEVGHVALGQGEFAFDFYAIKHGAVEVLQAGQRIATLGDGDFFGEIGLVQQNPRTSSRRRSATVVVTAPTEAVAIAGGDMRRLGEEIPVLREALNRAVAERSQHA
ncbi:MAG: cyclic nucleotide-binding domain-containing protein [Solirubrobacteraceae bacterium]